MSTFNFKKQSNSTPKDKDQNRMACIAGLLYNANDDVVLAYDSEKPKQVTVNGVPFHVSPNTQDKCMVYHTTKSRSANEIFCRIDFKNNCVVAYVVTDAIAKTGVSEQCRNTSWDTLKNVSDLCFRIYKDGNIVRGYK